MKKDKIIFFVFVALFMSLFFYIKNEAVVDQNFQTYEQSVTHDDLEIVFQMLMSGNLDGVYGNTNKGVLYIIENQYIDKTYELNHPTRKIRILNQDEFDVIQKKAHSIIGYVKIKNVEYGDSNIINIGMDSVTVSYGSQWYGGDGGHGFKVFTKEDGKWINNSGFSRG